MRVEVTIEIRFGPVLVTIDLNYRPWTADPDPWEVHFGPLPLSTGDWLCSRPGREAQFSADILHIASGVTTHDVVLILSRVTHLPGMNPFFKGQSGVGKTGAGNSFDYRIPPGVGVDWTVIKGPPPPV